MRSRVAVATAVSRGVSVVAGLAAVLVVEVVAGAPEAAAATMDVRADAAARESIDLGVTGEVGLVAVVLGAVGMVYGLTRRRRRAVARQAEERARAAAGS